MAKSNFNYIYSTLPNLYFMTFEEVLEGAYSIYPDDEEKRENYIDHTCDSLRVLDDDEIKDLQSFIDEINEVIQNKGNRLYYNSYREVDQNEGYTLKDIKIFIEPGEYQGAQLAVSNDYKYLNKTNKKLVKKCLIKIAKKFKLWAYDLAYRFSNGETGFTKVREY